MRSFIKKLAGTMAFTMAVSAVAPAGVVFADNEAFIAMQGGDTMVANITLATGRAVDFRFVGAPANWAELDPTWTSSIPAVAEVNAAGIVTAKKEGITTITIALSNGWTATAKVTVKDIPNDPTAPVYLAFQNTLEAVTDAHVLLNTKDGVDFWFINAPEGWQNMNPTWTSSNTAVATVDGAGIVRGVTDGFTTLTFSLNGVVVASTEITVGNPVVEVPPVTEVPEEPVVEDEFVVEGIDACYESEEGYNYLDEAEFTVGDEVNLGVYYQAALVNGEEVIEDYTGVYVDEFEWVSSDETIATVEDGVLTAVAAGEVTLTATGVAVDGYEEEVTATITIAEAAIDTSYEIKQTTHNQLVLTFADETVAASVVEAKEKVNVVRDRSNATDYADKKFPVKNVTRDGNKVTVDMYLAFVDGGHYWITVDGEEQFEFITTLGAVDELRTTYATYEAEKVLKKNAAIANEDYDDDMEVRLSTKLFSNDVDVSNASGYHVEDVTYEFLDDSEVDSSVSLYDNVVVFEEAGVAVQIKAIYTYEDANGDEKVVEEIIELVSEEAPAYEIVGVKAWAFYTTEDKYDKLTWNKDKKHIRAYDDANIVALIEDNYGHVYVTEPQFTTDGVEYIYSADSHFLEEQYNISFVSTDVDDIIMNGNEVHTWKEVKNAGILFVLENERDDYKEDLYCAQFQVKEERKLATVDVTTEAFKVLANVEDDDASDDFVPVRGAIDGFAKKTIEIRVKDQDGKAYNDLAGNLTVTAVAKVDGKTVEIPVTTTTKKDSGYHHFYFDGNEIAELVSKDPTKNLTVKFVVTATDNKNYDNKKSDSVIVELVTPKGGSSYAVYTNNVSYAIGGDDKTAVRAADIKFCENRLGLNYEVERFSNDEVKDKDGNVTREKSGITIISTGSAYTEVANMKAAGTTENSDIEVHVGKRYLVVRDAKGQIMELTSKTGNFGIEKAKVKDADGKETDVDIENGEYKLVLSNVVNTTHAGFSHQVVQYATAGTYTVEVFEVAGFNNRGARFNKIASNRIVVTDNVSKISFIGQTKVESEYDGAYAIVDALKFSKDIAAGDIVDIEYDYKGTDNEYMVVKSITVRIPVNDESELSNIYYEQNIKIGKTIRVLQ